MYPKEDGEERLWQEPSVNDGPHVQSQALNARCEKILTVKAGNKTAGKEFSLKVLTLYFLCKVQ